MKKIIMVAAAGLIAISMVPAGAAPKNTPGHMMQRSGSVPGHPGASGYAPGHVKKFGHVRSARHFAPGHHARHHRHHHRHFVHHRKHHYVHHRHHRRASLAR
jgi:hypothetical protein